MSGTMVLLDRMRDRLEPQKLIFDPRHDPAHAVVLVGGHRSGTTKLAELMSSGPRTRLIFEPFHPNLSPWGAGWPGLLYRDPDDRAPSLRALWTRVLGGDLRSAYMDRHNQAHFVRRRVVKCVVAMNLVPWLLRWFPSTPIVYLVRNPLAVAHSIQLLNDLDVQGRQGWDDHWGKSADDVVLHPGLLDGPLREMSGSIREMWKDLEPGFERMTMRWAVENFVALKQLDPSAFQLIRFEEFFAEPDSHIDAVAGWTGLPMTAAHSMIAAPSQTDWSRTDLTRERQSERRDGWLEAISNAEIDRAREILGIFDLADEVDR